MLGEIGRASLRVKDLRSLPFYLRGRPLVRADATITLLTYASMAVFATFAGQTDVDRVTLGGNDFRLDALSEQRYTSAATP